MKFFTKLAVAAGVVALLSSAAYADSLKGKTIGFSQIGSESGWRAAETSVTKQQAEKRGINLKFADAQQKQENQIKAIRGFIAQGVDAILVAPVVSTGWDAVLGEAKDAKIPVILLDRGVDASQDLYLTSVASDQVKEGKVAGDWLVKTVATRSATSSSCRAPLAPRRPSTARRASKKPSRATTTSRSCAARPATSPAPRARKSWKASSRLKTAARTSAPCMPTTTTWPSAASRPSRMPA